jgi:hypothetical protein
MDVIRSMDLLEALASGNEIVPISAAGMDSWKYRYI